MMDDRLIHSMARLGRAISRIESQLDRKAAAPAEDNLIHRHETLRETAQSVLERLDRIIAEQAAAE